MQADQFGDNWSHFVLFAQEYECEILYIEALEDVKWDIRDWGRIANMVGPDLTDYMPCEVFIQSLIKMFHCIPQLSIC
jgi:hypothetical protein